MAKGHKVIVRWSWKETNKGSFRDLPAGNKVVADNAIAIYEFSEDKISGAWIQSDKLGFVQQMGIIPEDITTSVSNSFNPGHY
jgi:predicted ester cyclase